MFAKKTFFLLTCVGSVFFVSQGEAEGLIAADHGIGPPARTSLLEAFSHEYYSPRKRKFSSELAASDPVAQSEGPGESFRNPPIHLLPAPTAGVPPARGPAAAAATAVAPDRAAKAESHLLHEVLPERPSARGPEGAGDDVKKMKKTSEEAPLKVLAIRDGMNMKGFLPCPATASFVSREFGQRQGDPRGVSDLSILRHLGGRDENTGRRDVDDNKNYYKVDAVRSDRVIYPLCDRSSVADDVSEDDVERPLVKADLGGGDLYGGLARSLQSLGNHQNQRRLRKNQESRDDAEKNIVDGRLLNASSSTSSIENIIKFNNDNISYLDVVSVGGSGVALEKLGLEKLTAEALLRFIKKEKYEAVVAASKGVKPLLEVMRLAAREPQEREFFPGVILVNQGEMDPNAAGAAEIVKLSSHLNTRVVLTGQPRSTANGGGGTEEDMGWLRARWEQQPISIDDQPVDEAKLGEFFGTKREEQKAGTAAAAAAENSHEEKAGFGVFLYLARDRSPGVSVPDTHGLPISLVAPAGGYQVSSLQGEIVGPNRAATSKDPYIFEMLRWVRKSSFASSKGGDQMEDGDAEDEGPGGPSSDGWLTAMVRDVHHCHTLYLGKRTLRASPRRELRFTKLQTSPLQRNLLEQLEEKNGVFEKVAPGPVQEEEEELVGPPGSADLAARRGEEMNAGRRLAPVSSQQLKWLSRMVGDTDPQEGNLVVLTAAKIVPPPRLLRTYEKRREQIRAQNERQKNGWLSETGAEGLPGGNLQKARDAGLLDEPGPQHGGGGGGVSRRHPRTFDKALSEFFEKNPFEELAAIDGLKSDWRNPDPAQRDWEREEYFLHGAGPEAAKGICQSGFLTFAGGKIQSPSVYFTEDATVAFTYAGGPPAPPSAGGAAPGPREEERDQSRQAEKRLWEWMLEETGLGKREILFPGVPVHFILVGRLLRGNVRDLPVDPRRGVPLHPASVAEKACVLRGETTKFRHHQEFSSGEENVSCARRGEAEILMTDNNDNPEDNEANVHGPFFHSVEYMGQPIGLPRTAREVVLVGDGDDTVNREAVRGGDNSKTRKDSTSSAVLDHLQAPDYPNNDHTRIQNLAALAKFARGPKEQMLSGAKGALAFAREQQVVPSYLVAVVNRHVDAGKPGTVVFVKPGGNVWYDPGLAKWQCHYVQLLRRSTPATSSSNSSAAVSSAGGFANIHSLGDQWASWWVQPLYRVAEGKQRWRTSTGQNMIKERRTGLERERLPESWLRPAADAELEAALKDGVNVNCDDFANGMSSGAPPSTTQIPSSNDTPGVSSQIRRGNFQFLLKRNVLEFAEGKFSGAGKFLEPPEVATLLAELKEFDHYYRFLNTQQQDEDHLLAAEKKQKKTFVQPEAEDDAIEKNHHESEKREERQGQQQEIQLPEKASKKEEDLQQRPRLEQVDLWIWKLRREYYSHPRKGDNRSSDDSSGKPRTEDRLSLQQCLNSVKLIAENAINKFPPQSECRARRPKASCRVFQARVAPYPEAHELLRALGFEEKAPCDQELLRVAIARLDFILRELRRAPAPAPAPQF